MRDRRPRPVKPVGILAATLDQLDAPLAALPGLDPALLARFRTARALAARAAGLICVDNTLLQGEPYLPGEPSTNGAAVAAFDTMIAADARVAQVLVPLCDGLTLIRRIDAA